MAQENAVKVAVALRKQGWEKKKAWKFFNLSGEKSFPFWAHRRPSTNLLAATVTTSATSPLLLSLSGIPNWLGCGKKSNKTPATAKLGFGTHLWMADGKTTEVLVRITLKFRGTCHPRFFLPSLLRSAPSSLLFLIFFRNPSGGQTALSKVVKESFSTSSRLQTHQEREAVSGHFSDHESLTRVVRGSNSSRHVKRRVVGLFGSPSDRLPVHSSICCDNLLISSVSVCQPLAKPCRNPRRRSYPSCRRCPRGGRPDGVGDDDDHDAWCRGPFNRLYTREQVWRSHQRFLSDYFCRRCALAFVT